MTILPLDPAANATPVALAAFLARCQQEARTSGSRRLASITLRVDALDPLAVLESIYEPGEKHFYVEKPSSRLAIAGAEAVCSHAAEGPERFSACQRFVSETLESTIAVGLQKDGSGGPLFFAAFSFAPSSEPGDPFPALQVFVPRWQVVCREEVTLATANILIDASTPLEPLVERIWRAQKKFRAFDYAEPAFGTKEARRLELRESGGGEHYHGAVAKAVELIRGGAFDKIVLARSLELGSSEPFQPLRSLNGLRERFPDCFAFSVANGAGQSFLGASPERLVRVSGGKLYTEALAGSIRRGASASEDAALGNALLHDEKNLREQRTVAESIVRRLAPLGIAARRPERPVLRKLANVQHLHTPIEAELPAGVSLLDVLGRLHPTPAVGGSPRDAALPHIRPLEGFSRGLYAGAIGWLDVRGEGEFFVGLRSALLDGKRARLFAGAGIVAGSNPEKEFAETELKFRPMREALEV